MTGFMRPGARQAAAFGVAFDAGRDAHDARGAPPSAHAAALADARRRLPIFARRAELLYAVETHAVTVVVSDPGAGATSQAPQYLVEAGWAAGGRAVCCVQPGRRAAAAAAARAADEMGSPLGAAVGFAAPFEDGGGGSQLRYVTDAALMREMMDGPLLERYSVVVVDGAGARRLGTDVLLGLLRRVARRRRDLRLVLLLSGAGGAAAAADARAWAAYFDPGGGGAAAAEGTAAAPSPRPALLSVPGRGHGVRVHYLERPAPDYVRAAADAVAAIHAGDVPGDILVFLPGKEEAEAAARLLDDTAAGRRGGGGLRLVVARLHAGLPGDAAAAAAAPAPRGARKAVVAAAEAAEAIVSSLDGVVFVVDSMMCTLRAYDPLTGLDTVAVAPASRADAAARAAAAGRTRPGHAFRLCTEAGFEALAPAAAPPEAARADLAPAVLALKALGVDDVAGFGWPSPPPAEALVRALDTLHALRALGDDARLARPHGERLAELPLPPHLGAALLACAAAGCGVEGLTLAALLARGRGVWAPGGGAAAAAAARARFAVAEGDLVAYLNVWKAWERSGRSPRWAARAGVSHAALAAAAAARLRLAAAAARAGLPPPASALDADPAGGLLGVRKALAAGLFLNAAVLAGEAAGGGGGHGVYRLVRHVPGGGGAGGFAGVNGGGAPPPPPRLRIHASSVLARCRPACVLFLSAPRGASGWHEMRDLLAVEPGWLPEVAPHYYRPAAAPPPAR